MIDTALPDAMAARKVGRDLADSMGEAWVWTGSNLSPGERLHVTDQLRSALGITHEQRRRRQARMLVDAAMAAFNLRMEARQRSAARRIGTGAPSTNGQ